MANQATSTADIRGAISDQRNSRSSGSTTSVRQPPLRSQPSDHHSAAEQKADIRRATLADRASAEAIPQPSRPDPTAIPKICWFHKQFGQTSTKCLQPCSFKAPVIPIVPVKKEKIRSAIVIPQPDASVNKSIDASIRSMVKEPVIAGPSIIKMEVTTKNDAKINNFLFNKKTTIFLNKIFL